MSDYILRSDAVFWGCKLLDKYGACKMGPRCPDVCCSEIIDHFSDVPAADVQPVVHGEWKHVKWVEDKNEQTGGWWISRCSLCSMPYNEETRFCPHCGAKMDGKAKER